MYVLSPSLTDIDDLLLAQFGIFVPRRWLVQCDYRNQFTMPPSPSFSFKDFSLYHKSRLSVRVPRSIVLTVKRRSFIPLKLTISSCQQVLSVLQMVRIHNSTLSVWKLSALILVGRAVPLSSRPPPPLNHLLVTAEGLGTRRDFI